MDEPECVGFAGMFDPQAGRMPQMDGPRMTAWLVVGARGRYRLSVPASAYLVVSSRIHANGGSNDSVDPAASRQGSRA